MASPYKCLTAWECRANNKEGIKERKGRGGAVEEEVIQPVCSYEESG